MASSYSNVFSGLELDKKVNVSMQVEQAEYGKQICNLYLPKVLKVICTIHSQLILASSDSFGAYGNDPNDAGDAAGRPTILPPPLLMVRLIMDMLMLGRLQLQLM